MNEIIKNDEINFLILDLLHENYHTSPKIGFGLSNSLGNFYIPYEDAISSFSFLLFLQDDSIKKAVYDYKKMYVSLLSDSIILGGVVFDSILATYLINPDLTKEDLSIIATHYKNYGCNLQVGGQDQWGNITSGFELIRKIEGQDAKCYCLTFPLLLKPDGTKFGKTAGGAIWLDPELTSPYQFYQFWLNTSDEEVIDRLKEFTFLSKEEIEEINLLWVDQKETRIAQRRLAEEVTKLIHGVEGLEKAQRITKAVFSGDVVNLSKEEIEEAFKDDEVVSTCEDLLIMVLLLGV